MKKKLLLVFLFASATLTYAQNPVPNPGFETWTDGHPDSWSSSRISGLIDNLIPTSDAYAGDSAARGEVVSFSGAPYAPWLLSDMGTGYGFPVTQTYGNISFWYKAGLVGTDVLTVSVVFYDNTQTGCATAEAQITQNTNSYTLYTIPVINFGNPAASATILFSIVDTTGVTGGNIGSWFDVDEVSLSGNVGISNTASAPSLIVFPNPSWDLMHISLLGIRDGVEKLELANLSGKTIMERNDIAPAASSVDLNVKGISQGMYILRVITPDGILNKKVFISGAGQ